MREETQRMTRLFLSSNNPKLWCRSISWNKQKKEWVRRKTKKWGIKSERLNNNSKSNWNTHSLQWEITNLNPPQIMQFLRTKDWMSAERKSIFSCIISTFSWKSRSLTEDLMVWGSKKETWSTILITSTKDSDKSTSNLKQRKRIFSLPLMKTLNC